MIKTLIRIFIVFAFFHYQFSAAAETTYGTCLYQKETLYSINCFGPTKLTQVTVNGKVSIAGPFDADNSKVDAMEVTGVANMNNSLVKGDAVISGFLNAKKSQFEGDLEIGSSRARLSGSSVKGSITIKTKEKEPVLELICGTKIQGNIKFKDQPGIVKRSKDSVITGQVTNGSVQEFVSKEKCD